MLVWDNQQETSWFTGILEAEGTCGRTHKVGGQQIRIANTDKDILDTCISFLQRKAITFGLHALDSKKPLTTISICGKNNCYTLIKWLGNSFQCRRDEFLDKLQLGSSTTERDATLTTDLHWLVGMFEGEGCITLDRDRNTYAPRIRFVNTNELIIQRYVKTLYDNNLSWYVYKRVSDKSTEISMTGMLRCKRFLVKLVNLWRSSIYRYRAEKLLSFLNLRLLMPKGTPYTREQEQIYYDLR